MSETIKAYEAKMLGRYWVHDLPCLCVNPASDQLAAFWHPDSETMNVKDNEEIIPLPDDAGYDYELPPDEPDYAELHAKCGLQVGDRVRVTSKTEPNGWDGGWNKFMLGDQLGKCGIITKDCGAAGFRLKVNPFYDEWAFPCTSLEKIEPEYRPFANAAEFEPHRDRWVKDKNGSICRPGLYDDSGVRIYSNVFRFWDDAMQAFKFDDGSTFGVEVTQ